MGYYVDNLRNDDDDDGIQWIDDSDVTVYHYQSSLVSMYSMATVHFQSYHQQFDLSEIEGLSDTQRSLLAQQYKIVEVTGRNKCQALF